MTIPIVFACDDNYAMPTAVAIRSLIDSRAAGTSYLIHVLGNGLSPEHVRKLESLGSAKACVGVQNVADAYRGRIATHTHVTTTTLYRFDVGELFPAYDRLIYLDGDIVVQQDLGGLFATELHGACVAAVRQMNISELPPFRPGDRRQFYAGVLLLDTARMRREGLRTRLFEAIRDRGVGCNDQIAFNLVLGDQVKLVSPTYNYCNVNDMLCSPGEACAHYEIERGAWLAAQRRPAIIHYIDGKPWNRSFCLRERAWLRAFRASPYGDMPLRRVTTAKMLAVWLLDRTLPRHLGRSTLRHAYVRLIKRDW